MGIDVAVDQTSVERGVGIGGLSDVEYPGSPMGMGIVELELMIGIGHPFNKLLIRTLKRNA